MNQEEIEQRLWQNLHKWSLQKKTMNPEALRMAGVDVQQRREKDDFYPTPPAATQALLDREKFDGQIYECACGDGAMSEVLIENGYDVYSSDLINRGYGETGIDFLKTEKPFDNIITNPPFKLGPDFVLHSFKLARKKIAFFGKLNFLEGQRRRKKIFNLKKLKKVYVFSGRVSFTKRGATKSAGGLISFAWYVFDQNYNGLPQIDWI